MLVVDDYGHHPTEIAAVLAAARATLDRRLIVAFQPHRYSRTAAAAATRSARRCSDADEIVLTDIYAAGEEPIPGVTVEALADVDSRADPAVRCTWSRRSTTWCRELLQIVTAGRRGDHARRRIDRHGAEAARRGARRSREAAH